jgi:hypothetical protein
VVLDQHLHDEAARQCTGWARARTPLGATPEIRERIIRTSLRLRSWRSNSRAAPAPPPQPSEHRKSVPHRNLRAAHPTIETTHPRASLLEP